MLEDYLVMLRDRRLYACVYLAQSDMWAGGYRALLANMGVDADSLPAAGPVLAVTDPDGGPTLYLPPGETARAGFGSVSLAREADGAYGVRIGGQTVLTAGPDAAAAAVAVDVTSGETAAPAVFGASGAKLTG